MGEITVRDLEKQTQQTAECRLQKNFKKLQFLFIFFNCLESFVWSVLQEWQLSCIKVSSWIWFPRRATKFPNHNRIRLWMTSLDILISELQFVCQFKRHFLLFLESNWRFKYYTFHVFLVYFNVDYVLHKNNIWFFFRVNKSSFFEVFHNALCFAKKREENFMQPKFVCNEGFLQLRFVWFWFA